MKPIISKSDFVQYINAYKKTEEAISSLCDIIFADIYESDIGTTHNYFLGLLSKLLNDNKNCEKLDILSWWVYDCNFGEEAILYNEDGSVYKELKTPEALFDYFSDYDYFNNWMRDK